MALPTAGEILNEINKKDIDPDTKLLIRQLSNIYGTNLTNVKQEILANAKAEMVTCDGEDMIPFSTLQSIVTTAGDTL